jgi:magnesium chelatase family protein
MLAKRLAGILPPLTFEEAIETTKVHNVAGHLQMAPDFCTSVPFARRTTPSPTPASSAAVSACHDQEKPASRHNGMLSLDEFPEFPRDILEMLRQPLEDGSLSIARSAMTLRFPSNFMLVAAMNPCPCRH